MSLVLNTNMASLNSQRAIANTQSAASTAMQRLSSGLRVNSAKDDAAGLAIANRMDGQVRGLNVAIRNANDGISMLQTADGALSTMGNILGRMRELAVQGANGSYDTADYTLLAKEYDELKLEVDRIATDTKFNGLSVVGTDANTFDYQVGADAGQTVSVTTTDQSGLGAGLGSLTTAALSSAEITALDTAIETINTERANVGAGLSRLDFTVQNLRTTAENQSAAKSRIMDADFSQESAALARTQVLQQAGIAMLAQANQQPQQILSLLR